MFCNAEKYDALIYCHHTLNAALPKDPFSNSVCVCVLFITLPLFSKRDRKTGEINNVVQTGARGMETTEQQKDPSHHVAVLYTHSLYKRATAVISRSPLPAFMLCRSLCSLLNKTFHTANNDSEVQIACFLKYIK